MTDSVAACRENDLPCFQEGFLERGKQIDSLGRELSLTKQQLELSNGENSVLKLSNTSLKGSLDAVAPGLRAGERKWYESNQLWYGLGIGTGVLITVAGIVFTAWALGHVAAH